MNLKRARQSIKNGKLPIHDYFEACQDTNSDGDIEQLISLNPKGVTETDDLRKLPVYYAIRNCATIEEIVVLLGVTSDSIKGKDSEGFNLPHLALMSGLKLPIWSFLLYSYPELVVERLYGKTSTLASAVKLHAPSDILKLLLRIYPNACSSGDMHGNLPIHDCCRFRNGVVECSLLLEVYAEGARACSSTGKIALHFAAESTCNPAIIDLLLSNFAEGPTTKDSLGKLPIYYCFQDPPTVSELKRWTLWGNHPEMQLTSSSTVLRFSSVDGVRSNSSTALIPIVDGNFSICLRVEGCEPYSIESLGLCAGQWRNRAGCVVRAGKGAGAESLYCGRYLNTRRVPGFKERCGPSDGVQCPDCWGLTVSNPPPSPPSNTEENSLPSLDSTVIFGATYESWGLKNHFPEDPCCPPSFYSGGKALNMAPRKLQVQ
jgi:hypothetical protein